MARLARFAWAVLAWTVAVILWGAYVRATGSGAGCGAHWPLCDGQVVPRAPTVEMLVEYSHRATSGLALLAVVALVFWTWRVAPRAHPARRTASWALVFMLTEAGVGAALVLFQLVAGNESMARALFMAVHLLNTYVLVAWLTLTAWHLSGGPVVRARGRSRVVGWLAVGAAGLMIVGASGAVAALGDTLYPAGSLREALAADLSSASRLLIRLRLFHPLVAVAVAVGLMAGGLEVRGDRRPGVSRLGFGVATLAFVQVAGGFLNVLLLAPVWMQLVHLLVADTLWIAFVLLGARLLGDTVVAQPATT